MGTTVSIDGVLVGPEDAKVSVFDRGFLYGDSIYEVIRTYGGEPFELGAHLQRLEHSARLIALRLPWPTERLAAEIRRTVDAAACALESRETYIRVVASRGSGDIGLDPALAENPLMVIIARPLSLPPLELYSTGVDVAVVSVQRVAQAAVDPSAKTGNYLNNLLALKEARDRGAYEALMLDAGRRITEGSTSNLFVVRGGALATPPKEVGILEGVTRRMVLGVAVELGIACEEVHLRESELRDADESFITSTIREILPVTTCDGRPIGTGRVGPVTQRIQTAFRELVGIPLGPAGF